MLNWKGVLPNIGFFYCQTANLKPKSRPHNELAQGTGWRSLSRVAASSDAVLPAHAIEDELFPSLFFPPLLSPAGGEWQAGAASSYGCKVFL